MFLSLFRLGRYNNFDTNFFAAELVHFVRGQTGYAQMVVRNYLYLRSIRNGTTTHWKCALYSNGRCRSRCATTECGRLIIAKNFLHTHEPDNKRLLNKTLLYTKKLRRVVKLGHSSMFNNEDF